MKRTAHALLLLALVLPAGVASASPRRRVVAAPDLTLGVEGDPRPFHLRVHVDVANAGLVSALADERFLAFDVVRERGRPLRCDYPAAPRRVDPLRVVANPTVGTALVDVIVDVRLFCVGPAFDALSHGARLVARYGFRTGGRDHVVSRGAGRARPAREAIGQPFRFVPPETAAPGDAPVRVGMPSVAGTAARVVVQPYVEAVREARVYFRSDLLSFVIRKPSGEQARCGIDRTPITPIVDFFTRMAPGRRLSASVELTRVCPGVFSEPGIYDVLTVLDLPYDGGNVGLTAVTGTFRGSLSFVRVAPPPDEDPSRYVRPLPGS